MPAPIIFPITRDVLIHKPNFLMGFLTEPILLTKDKNEKVHCLTNVCSHRAPDYYNLDDLFSEEHLLVRDAARQWVKPEFPKQIISGLAEIGSLRTLYSMKNTGEIERGDSGVRSTASVQSSLVINVKNILPKLASGEWMGSFGLTEPNHGSNPSGMETKYKDMGDHYLLNGAKLWISNSPFCDVAVVWAKNEEGRIHGLIVEPTGELIFSDVKVPKENLLTGKTGLGAPLGCLDSARYGISWGAIGAAMDCYDTALRYAKERIQFGKPIAAFQLQQKKLAEMIT
ncbi:Glutaryl-CoA dehydrogenase, mitochondrial [Nymphon striatum]|nr:Glutaryl-CoA dehydrogenase, mitochondrial [Nymphon striatum]